MRRRLACRVQASGCRRDTGRRCARFGAVSECPVGGGGAAALRTRDLHPCLHARARPPTRLHFLGGAGVAGLVALAGQRGAAGKRLVKHHLDLLAVKRKIQFRQGGNSLRIRAGTREAFRQQSFSPHAVATALSHPAPPFTWPRRLGRRCGRLRQHPCRCWPRRRRRVPCPAARSACGGRGRWHRQRQPPRPRRWSACGQRGRPRQQWQGAARRCPAAKYCRRQKQCRLGRSTHAMITLLESRRRQRCCHGRPPSARSRSRLLGRPAVKRQPRCTLAAPQPSGRCRAGRPAAPRRLLLLRGQLRRRCRQRRWRSEPPACQLSCPTR